MILLCHVRDNEQTRQREWLIRGRLAMWLHAEAITGEDQVSRRLVDGGPPWGTYRVETALSPTPPTNEPATTL